MTASTSAGTVRELQVSPVPESPDGPASGALGAAA